MAPSEDFLTLRAGVHELLQELGQLLGELVERPAAAGGEEDDDAHRYVIDVQLSSFFKSFKELKRRHDDESLGLAVLALTKSGKSTLINALVGHEIMPVNNVPETARICKITHRPGTSAPALSTSKALPTPPLGTPYMDEAGVRYVGDRDIRYRLQELNSRARCLGRASSSSSTPDLGLGRAGSDAAHHFPAASPLRTAPSGSASTSVPLPGSPIHSGGGSLASEPILNIHAPVAAIQEYDSSDVAKLYLLDTPGPNEAGEEGLRFQVERLLGDVDAVLYMLDYTKLKTCEEEAMFRRLRDINPQLVRRLSQRLFFVVNKVDAVHVNEGLGPDEVREYVANLVTRQLQLEGFSLAPEQVLLLSARNALLSRLVLSGRASEDVMRRFMTLAFGYQAATAMAAATAGGSGAQAGQRGGRPSMPSLAITTEIINAAANAMLADSGVLDLEQQVLAFLYAHGGAVKLLAVVDDIARLLHEVRNVAVSCKACLESSVAQLEQRAAALRAELQGTLDAFDSVMADTGRVAGEVTREVSEHLRSLRGRLFSQIISTLDADPEVVAAAVAAAAPAGSPAAAAGAAAMARAARPAASVAGRWQRVRDKFLSFFTSLRSLNAEGGAAPVARSRSREEMAALLLDLHEDLLAQIHAEVGEFWHVLEACANARHAELLTSINTHLEQLSRQVESAVSSRLEVRLEPVTLAMRMPSALEFHTDLQQLIDRGIVETQEKHIRVAQRQCQERETKYRYDTGICKWGQYWASVPRTRTVVETYSVTMYELQPAEVASHFVQMVDGAISSTEAALSSYVSGFICKQLEGARAQVQQYSDRYLSATSCALEAGQRGATYQAAALAQVQSYLSQVERIAAKLSGVQEQAELLVPRIQDAVPFDEMLEELEELNHNGQQHEGEEGEEEQQQEQQQASRQQEQEAPAEAEVQQQGSRQVVRQLLLEEGAPEEEEQQEQVVPEGLQVQEGDEQQQQQVLQVEPEGELGPVEEPLTLAHMAATPHAVSEEQAEHVPVAAAAVGAALPADVAGDVVAVRAAVPADVMAALQEIMLASLPPSVRELQQAAADAVAAVPAQAAASSTLLEVPAASAAVGSSSTSPADADEDEGEVVDAGDVVAGAGDAALLMEDQGMAPVLVPMLPSHSCSQGASPSRNSSAMSLDLEEALAAGEEAGGKLDREREEDRRGLLVATEEEEGEQEERGIVTAAAAAAAVPLARDAMKEGDLEEEDEEEVEEGGGVHGAPPGAEPPRVAVVDDGAEDILEYEDVPFDYTQGFARAMSTSELLTRPSPTTMAPLSASVCIPGSTVTQQPGPSSSRVTPEGAGGSGLAAPHSPGGTSAAGGDGSTDDWTEVAEADLLGVEGDLLTGHK